MSLFEKRQENEQIRGPISAEDLARSFPKATHLKDNLGYVYQKGTDGYFHKMNGGQPNADRAWVAAGETMAPLNKREIKRMTDRGEVFMETRANLANHKYSFEQARDSGKNVLSGNVTNDRLNNLGMRTRDAQANLANFSYFNNLLVNAIQKDAKGRLIEGGVLGGISKMLSGKSEVSKVIESVRAWSPEAADRMQNALQQIAARLNSSRLSNTARALLGSFGTRTDREVRNMITGERSGGAVKGIIETIAISALSSAITGSPSVYLGSLRVPFLSIQSFDNPDKDAIAYAITGKSYAEVVGEADSTLDAYNDNTIKAGKNTYDREVLADTHKANEYVGNSAANALRKSAGLFEFRDKKNANKLASPEVSNSEKMRILEQQIREINRELASPFRWRKKDANRYRALEEAQVLLDNIQGENRLERNILAKNTSGDVRNVSTLLGSARSFEEFDQRYHGSYDPNLRGMLEDYYDNVDPAKLDAITPYLANMARSYMKGGAALRQYLNGQNGIRENLSSYRLSVSNSTGRYFKGSEVKVANGEELSDFVRNASVKSPNTPLSSLVDVYARNIAVWSNGGINLNREDILQGMRSAQMGKPGKPTLNSTIDQLQLPNAKYGGRQWLFSAPATMIIVNPETGGTETVRAHLTLGIKPNCMNLQPIDITFDRGQRWYDITNGTSRLPLRVPLSIGIPRGNKTPRDRVSSTPNGNVTNAPTAPGYNANVTETFHQTITNTAIQPGQFRPGVDGIAPLAGSNIPINPSRIF